MNTLLGLTKVKNLWEMTKGNRLVITFKMFYGFWCWPLLLLVISILREGKVTVEAVWYNLILGVYMLALQLFWIEFLLTTLGAI